jgi:hypothetical protein
MAASDKSTIGATYNQSASGEFKTTGTNYITAARLRGFVDALLQSYPNLIDDAYSGLKGLKPGVNSIVGLKTISTLNLSLNVFITFRDGPNNNVLRVYELVSGTEAENSPTIIRPDDYADTTNEKVWKLALSGSDAMKWGGAWSFPSGAFPTSTFAGTFYVAIADHGTLGDADYVQSGTWFVSNIDGASAYSGYYYNI